MAIDDFNIAWLAITTLEARDMLMSMKIADFPQMQKNERRKLHRKIYTMAYPKDFDETEQKPLSTEQLAMLLARK